MKLENSKKIKKNEKRVIFGMIFFGVFIIGFVNAGLLTSEAGVQYENRILDEFSRLNETNETFIEVIIHLKYLSDVDGLVSSFSEEELKNVINRKIPNRSSNRIGAELSEEGFFKLIQDERVEKVYYNAPVHATSNFPLKQTFLAVLGILFLILLYFFLRRKQKRNKRHKKEKMFVIFISLFIVITFSFVSASSNLISLEKWENNLSTSNKEIIESNQDKYEPRLLNEFVELKYSFTNQTNSSKKLKETNETFIKVIIDLEDFSEVGSLVSSFSGKELKNVINRKIPNRSSNRIGAELSEEGFFKLIQDERVEKVYYNAPVHASLSESISIINADDAWSSGYTGDNVKICIIDTGIDTDHSDLSGNIVDEYCYCSDNCCPDNTGEDDSAEDDNGHGTHVAGIIASQDGTYTGVAYDVDLYIVKALDDDGDGNFLDLGDAIDWCKNHEDKINIISMSLGDGENHPGDSSCPTTLNTEIDNAYDKNITIVAAAGNEEYNDGINYPACNNQIISVGATYDADHGYEGYPWDWIPITCWDWSADEDTIPCFSNTGPNLDLLAPGCKIYSTWNDGDFDEHCGTSMSTPMVAGAAALLLEKDSDLTPDEIKTILQNTGEDIGESWKRIDVEAALDSIEGSCECGSWSVGSCGTGGCGSEQKPWTRTCTPSECSTESQCVYDESCVEEEPEVNDCTESGYEFCIESSYGDCDVSIASNLYENVNDISWGAVNDAWDPYVIGSYSIGWKDVDAEQMYYNCDGDTDCEYGGCDCDEIADESTMVTVNAPGVAYRKEILGYDDTASYACWVWWYPFSPNYGEDNPIYVLDCFGDSDCSSGYYCDKSSSWSNWDCVAKKSDGQNCSLDSECSSDYCDNDDLGSTDDDWCFTPYNTYFDGQENTKCEISTGQGDYQCDEKQVGEDLNSCSGIAFYEEECNSTCNYIDITSVFECDESGCSCSESLCDGLTTGNNITTCSSEETYFSDKCTSSAGGEDRGDNICRNSSFASGCSADPECGEVLAGTGNCNLTCSYDPKLTGEEHTWLEAIHDCITNKNCNMYNLLLESNTTIEKAWEHTKPTDDNVIIFENVTNKVVDSSNNLTIDYTVAIPIKPGYSVGDYLPIRIGYWFLNNSNTTCYDQGEQPVGVSEPYCQPLIVETIGPMGGEVNFTVELGPSLPTGDYSIKRIIDIDPNNVWINYGQELISPFRVIESLKTYSISSKTTGELIPETTTSRITGAIVGTAKYLLSGWQIVVLIAIIGGVLVIFIVLETLIKLKEKEI